MTLDRIFRGIIRRLRAAIGHVRSLFGAKPAPAVKPSNGIAVDPAPPFVNGGQFSIRLTNVAHPSGTFFVPQYAKHRPAVQAIMAGKLYEPHTHFLIPKLLELRPGNMVHAGTFFGDMLPTFSRACTGTVYAFEPVLENYVLAKLCVQQNKLDNVFLLNAGLGAGIAVAKVDTGSQINRHYGGGSKIAKSGQSTVLLTIDSLGIDNLSIIQLDVEGHELEALRGAVATIRKHSPVILIEDNKNNCADFLTSVNYAYAGKIPGLMIWASKGDKTDIASIVTRAMAEV